MGVKGLTVQEFTFAHTCSNPGSLWYGFSFNKDWIEINTLESDCAGLQAGPDQVLFKKKEDKLEQVTTLFWVPFGVNKPGYIFQWQQNYMSP